MMNISNAINIKKEKLRYELSKKNPNKKIVFRLKESIHRHSREMCGLQRRRKRNRRMIKFK